MSGLVQGRRELCDLWGIVSTANIGLQDGAKPIGISQ